VENSLTSGVDVDGRTHARHRASFGDDAISTLHVEVDVGEGWSVADLVLHAEGLSCVAKTT
jgi:hypothetical protein